MSLFPQSNKVIVLLWPWRKKLEISPFLEIYVSFAFIQPFTCLYDLMAEFLNLIIEFLLKWQFNECTEQTCQSEPTRLTHIDSPHIWLKMNEPNVVHFMVSQKFYNSVQSITGWQIKQVGSLIHVKNNKIIFYF